jgi:hypothetical protein
MKLTVSRVDELIAEINEELPDDLAPMLEILQQEEGSFFVLTRDNGDFLQGSWHPPDGYYMEYNEPAPECLHRTLDLVPSEITANILNLFRLEAPGWKDLWEWQPYDPRAPVEADSPPEGEVDEDAEDACMGNFEGVALRHVLKELERHEIPCRVEPDGVGFQVYVPAEFNKKGRDLIAALFPE